MFESFTDVRTLNRLLETGHIDKFVHLVRNGANVNRRAPYAPQDTPLDIAVRLRNVELVHFVLMAGAEVQSSSIEIAVETDFAGAIQEFALANPHFYRKLSLRGPLEQFNLLEYAESHHAHSVVAELGRTPLTSGRPRRAHWTDCTAFLIQIEEFVSFGHVNVDGLVEVTKGYYCAKCKRFVAKP